MIRARAGGVELAVREWGSADADPLVFLHGLGDHTGEQVHEAAPIFVERGFRVLAPDLPGFGDSVERLPDEAYELPRVAAIVDELLERLGVARAAVVGASWGAMIGRLLAARPSRRVRALALLDGGYRVYERPAASLEALKESMRERVDDFEAPSWEALFAGAEEFFGFRSPGVEHALRTAVREEADGRVVSRIGPDLYAAASWGLSERPYPAVDVPVLLVHATEGPPGAEGREAALAGFRAELPQAEVVPFPGGHHWLLEESPQAVARVVADWLRRAA
ncbi:MAG TPA: alpha/beta hydrolase [Gaiellaceae bacterium]|nr:alpha/beta hydrolase [Gaiellaceae bacterium]